MVRVQFGVLIVIRRISIRKSYRVMEVPLNKDWSGFMGMSGILNRIKKFRGDLLNMVDSLPDAQSGVTQISKRPAIAIVKLSHVGKNKGILDPRYYLNSSSKRALKEMIKRTRIENLPDRINKVIQSGVIVVSRYERVKLMPEFVSYLKDMWDGVYND